MMYWFDRVLSSSNWKLRVKNGKSIYFWKDIWAGNTLLSFMFRRLFNLSNHQDAKFHEMFEWLSYTPSQRQALWRRQLRGWEIDEESDLIEITLRINLCEGIDQISWVPGN